MSGVNVRIPTIKRNVDEKVVQKKTQVVDEKTKISKSSNETAEILKKIGKVDSNEKFYNIEDKIAAEMGHEVIYEQFTAVSTVVRQALVDYMNGKKELIPDNIISQISKMRRLARLSNYATAQLRANSSEMLERVDVKLLQLQNLSSEVQHIQKEIDRCLDYSGGDEEIDLIPIEQFYEEAPELISNPEVTKADEHLQRLARLNYESIQRRQMQSTLSELEGRRNVLGSDIRGKELRLQSMKPKLEALFAAAEPVQDLLGIKYNDTEIEENQKQLAVSLPTPLTVLYTHVTSYKDLMTDKNIDVLIIDSTNDSKTEKEESDGKKKRQNDETIQDKIDELEDRIFETHPMSVRVNIQCPKNEVKVTLHFYYLLELKVTSMKWEIEGVPKQKNSLIMNEEMMLCGLFEGDSGDTCPNSIGEMKMEKLKLSFDSIAKDIGKPFKFVQLLSGVSNGHETGQVTDFFRKLVNLIRERVDERLELSTIIKSLESRKLDNIEVLEENKIKISLFRHLDSSTSVLSPRTLEAIAASKVSERFLYKADFEDPEMNMLTAFISIPCNYPKNSAIIELATKVEGCEEPMKNIEELVNLIADQSISIETQIGRILANFDSVFSKC